MRILLLFLLACTTDMLIAQPSIQWQRVQGNMFDDVFTDVMVSSDGEIYAVGVFHSNPPASGAKGVQDVWLVKYSASGDLIWEKKYGGTKSDLGHSIAELSNGDLAIVATTKSNDGDVTTNNGNDDVWVFTVDTAGALQWQLSLGGSGFDQGKRVFAANTGMAVVYEKGIPDYGLAISFISGNGSVTGTYYYGSSCIDKCIDGILLSDGDLMLTGIVECADGDISNVYGNNDVWLVKISSSAAQVVWEKTYGGTGNDVPGALVQGSDGRVYVIAQSLFSDNDVPPLQGGQDIWVFAVDASNGNLAWSKTYGSTSNDFGDDIISSDNALYAIGTAGGNGGHLSGINNGKQDLWVLKLDLDGNLVWEVNFGSSQNDKGYGLAANRQQLLAVGFSGAGDGDVPVHFGLGDAWLISLGQPVGLRETSIRNLQAYPQPFNNYLNIKINDAPTFIQIYNINGVEVFNDIIYEKEGRLDLSILPSGIYSMRIRYSTGTSVLRIIKI